MTTVNNTNNFNLDIEILNILQDFDISAHLSGYEFLEMAIKEVYQDRSLITQMTKGLYPLIANIFTTEEKEITPAKAERCIRHAIKKAWDQNKLGSNFNKKPCSSEFIAKVVEKLRLQNLQYEQQMRLKSNEIA